MERARISYSRWAVVTAVLVAAALLMVLYLTGIGIGRTTSREDLIAAIWAHVGFGVVTAPMLLLYAAWRFLNRTGDETRNAWRTHAGNIARWLLAACVVFLAVTGPLVVWTYGSPLKVFDWFVIGNPIGAQPTIHQLLEDAHGFVAHLSPAVIGVDVLMVMWLAPRQTIQP